MSKSGELANTAVIYQGTVIGLGAGTGAAFALLPAQNATGNWIKIVQRVPVRIAIDEKDLAEHPLRVGLSMDVTIDTADRKGKRLNDTPRNSPAAITSVFETQSKVAEQRVSHIIAANLGRPAR